MHAYAYVMSRLNDAQRETFIALDRRNYPAEDEFIAFVTMPNFDNLKRPEIAILTAARAMRADWLSEPLAIKVGDVWKTNRGSVRGEPCNNASGEMPWR